MQSMQMRKFLVWLSYKYNIAIKYRKWRNHHRTKPMIRSDHFSDHLDNTATNGSRFSIMWVAEVSPF